jgi:hypothetical protein
MLQQMYEALRDTSRTISAPIRSESESSESDHPDNAST